MKRTVSLILALILFLFSAPMSVFAEKDPIYDLNLDSQGVYLLNTETETVLYAKAENARMFPASLTKIMTALVVLRENCNLKEETITVTSMSMFDYIIKDRGVHMGLKTGETFTVYDLLAGLMIESYCDAADLLAEHFGDGDISKFIQKMNDTAKALGLENSHFENAHGLHHSNHYSSPRDMAVILREAMKHDAFREIITLRGYAIPATEKCGPRELNYTVRSYNDGAKYYLPCYVGGKSGFTNEAGRCLATYSEMDGVTYISVLLGANLDGNKKYPGNMAEIETNTLVSYAYENFSLQTVFEKGQEVARLAVTDSKETVSVTAAESLTALVRKESQPTYELDLPKEISVKEVKDGKAVGSLNFTFNSKPVEKSGALTISWDGKPITTKSALKKSAEGAAKAISNIFSEDKTFVILFILLLLVMIITLPLLRLTAYLHRRKFRKPKH
ncbi:MAG: D-alanyl-D-alanine carboxypeptidase [Clostridia bacterium]|nr:D-alanyl-D-alanine carboxypeptidase [Clostridia bacterium]